MYGGRSHADLVTRLPALNQSENVLGNNLSLNHTRPCGLVGTGVSDITCSEEVGVLGILELQCGPHVDEAVGGVEERGSGGWLQRFEEFVVWDLASCADDQVRLELAAIFEFKLEGRSISGKALGWNNGPSTGNQAENKDLDQQKV